MDNEISQEQELEIARLLEEEKRKTVLEKSKEAQKAEGIDEDVKTVDRLRNIYRIINGTAALSVIGIIITFLVMNGQLIFGNLFKVKFIPALSLIEIFILGLIDFLLIAAVLIFLMIIYFIVNPCALADAVGAWWANLFGVICDAGEIIKAVK